MKGKEAIREIMTTVGVTNAAMASRLNISPAALWDRLNNKKNKDLSLTVLCQMANLLDYKVVIMPRTRKVPEDAYVVEGEI